MLKDLFAKNSIAFDELDGLSVAFETWRFNIRQSNTEPLVRLNVETRGDEKLLGEKTDQLINLITKV